MRILDFVQHEQERRFTPFGSSCKQIFNLNVGVWRRLGYNALMLQTRGHLVQLPLVHELNDNSPVFGLRHYRLGQMFLGAFSYPYFINRASGSERFKQRVLPGDPFLVLHKILLGL
ncbi:hypothetical protein D3C73_1366120 [compost metagenome]